MKINARYVHTNLIARDWRRLAAFYQQVFGCVPVLPERDLTGEWLERGSAVPRACIRGIHLRLPGFGDAGPTLEVFQYAELADAPPAPANRAGFGHIAFAVEDVMVARDAVLSGGGSAVGSVETVVLPAGIKITWMYVRDPEGNIIELQRHDQESAA